MKNSGLVLVLAVLVPVFAAPAQAGKYKGTLAVQAAVEMLEAEIERDRRLTDGPMNIIRLRQARRALAGAVAEKEKVAAGLEEFEDTVLERAIEAFSEILEQEKEIAASQGITQRYKRITYYTLRDNIPRKEFALTAFKKWLGLK